MHLTNYAINKLNENYVSSEDYGVGDSHKRCLWQIYEDIIKKEGGREKALPKVKLLKQEIKEIIIKTLITGQPAISHLYRSCQPDDYENELCF